MNNKKNTQFNIINNRSTTHGNYYTGTISLNNLSSVLIDEDRAKIDLGLIHAKSAVERGIKFVPNKDEVPNGKLYWVVWVAVDRNEQGSYYAGVAACPMMIDRENRRGWKNLADHVNRMDDVLKRRIKLDGLDEVGRKALKELLVNHNPEMWENSCQELKDLLS
ncbi:YwhD family protein [Hazenella coriacea]|uniref:YwhD-like protein n=1 Tax=Hazenella coriacea TaxID=1179467 RepID=A0A4R3L8W4_9BACL|nr:YwhD family protein [Hazenella coriacea]TCS95525.1 YwhD-like protein [Hazenella coriacea]